MTDTTTEIIRDLIPLLTNLAQMLDEMKIERGQHPTIEWTTYNQEQREALTAMVRRAQAALEEQP